MNNRSFFSPVGCRQSSSVKDQSISLCKAAFATTKRKVWVFPQVSMDNNQPSLMQVSMKKRKKSEKTSQFVNKLVFPMIAASWSKKMGGKREKKGLNCSIAPENCYQDRWSRLCLGQKIFKSVTGRKVFFDDDSFPTRIFLFAYEKPERKYSLPFFHSWRRERKKNRNREKKISCAHKTGCAAVWEQ